MVVNLYERKLGTPGFESRHLHQKNFIGKQNRILLMGMKLEIDSEEVCHISNPCYRLHVKQDENKV